MNRNYYINILKEIRYQLYDINNESDNDDNVSWYEKNSAYVNSTINKINRFIISSSINKNYSEEYLSIETEAKKISNNFVDKMKLEGNTIKVKSDLVKPLNITTKYTNKCLSKASSLMMSGQFLKYGIKYGTKDYGEENNKSTVVIILRIIACICLAICFLHVARFLVRVSLLIFKIFILLLRKIIKPSMKTFTISYSKECFKILNKHKTSIGYGILFGSMSIIIYLASKNIDESNKLLGIIDFNWISGLVNSIKDKIYISE